MGNADQLEQVFLNMMLNARDAMEQGGVLNIRTWADAQFIYVEFKDNGKGIPPEMLERLFEPFVSTKGENGSGLGLFVSYEIITNHQGKIDVQSAQGEGTTFTIALPVAQ
jgi:signal transduction histidine kinase